MTVKSLSTISLEGRVAIAFAALPFILWLWEAF